MSIEVVPHDPAWIQKFEREAAVWARVLGSVLSEIHHIGSTAVPGIYAKPIIDILAAVTSLDAVDALVADLETHGYEAMGEFGIAGRRYFRKDNSHGDREYHVHAFLAGSPEIERHLAFRDYLRSHSDVAAAYSELKRRLAEQHPADREAYMDGKDPFIKAQEQLALEWWRSEQ